MVDRNVHDFDEMGELYVALSFFGFALSAYAKARAVLEISSTPQAVLPVAVRSAAVAGRAFR
jgi:hypothetical protein